MCVAYGSAPLFSCLIYHEKHEYEKYILESSEIMGFLGARAVSIQKCEIILETKTEKLLSSLGQGFLNFNYFYEAKNNITRIVVCQNI